PNKTLTSSRPDTTGLHTLSLHDALPISPTAAGKPAAGHGPRNEGEAQDRDREDKEQHPHPATGNRRVDEALRRNNPGDHQTERGDRKSTRLNSSHVANSYAVICLKKNNI